MGRLGGYAAACAIVLLAVAGTAAAGAEDVRIDAVTPDTYLSGEPDETIAIHNGGDETVDIGDWQLMDSRSGSTSSFEGIVSFPGEAVIEPGQRLVVTEEATAWREDRSGDPDYEMEDTDPAVPQVADEGGNLALSNAGDEVVLADADGSQVDVAVYGDGDTAGDGWQGEAIPASREGEVLERDRDEVDRSRPDTDSAADWDDPRVTMIGQSHHAVRTFEDVDAVRTCTSPDNSFDTLEGFLAGARSSLDVQMYILDNPHVLDPLTDALDRGASMDLLMEGTPVGMSNETRNTQNWILERLEENGTDVEYMITDGDRKIHDRYNFLHQKVAVRDGEATFVSSGNWRDTGLPTDPSHGNREWCAVVDSPGLAGFVEDVLADDGDQDEYRDVVDFGATADDRYGPPPEDFEPSTEIPTGDYEPRFEAERLDAERATAILSPDTSLYDEHPDALIPRIENATEEVLVEALTVHKHWGSACCGTPEEDPNPFLEAVIDAARDGARVRVLLDSTFIFGDDSRNNVETVEYLRDTADEENLDIEAKLLDTDHLPVEKIHNKGVVIDGNQTYVGSMNWAEGSATKNREIGLVLEGHEPAEHYREVFFHDWNATYPTVRADRTPDGLVPAGEPVDFQATAGDEDGTVETVRWDFGDGETATGEAPSHTYEEPGAYTVRVTAEDDDGLEAHAELTVRVVEPPSPPRDVTAYTGPGLGNATVTWEAPADPGGVPVPTYRVYRAPPGGDAQLVAEVDGDQRRFTDTDRPLGAADAYHVAAVNPAGESPGSNASVAAGTGLFGFTVEALEPLAPLPPGWEEVLLARSTTEVPTLGGAEAAVWLRYDPGQADCLSTFCAATAPVDPVPWATDGEDARLVATVQADADGHGLWQVASVPYAGQVGPLIADR